MNQVRLSHFSSIFLSFFLLISPLPLSAMVNSLGAERSDDRNEKELYVYLGKGLSDSMNVALHDLHQRVENFIIHAS